MPIDPSDIFLAVVRIVAITALMVVFFGMFTSFKVTVQTADVERTAFELGETFISGNLSVERGIIDETKLSGWVIELDDPAPPETTTRLLRSNPRPEPVRHCLMGGRFVIRDEEGTGVSAMGMLAAPVEADMRTVAFPIWLAKGTALRPARLEVTTYFSPITRVLCAVETAWVEGQAEIQPGCPFEGLLGIGDCTLGSFGDRLCVSGRGNEECRIMNINVNPFVWDGGDRLRFTRVGDVIQGEVVTT